MKTEPGAAELEVQRVSHREDIPSDEDFQAWAGLALAGAGSGKVLTVRIVDEEESRRLNAAYRGREEPTNVLSFETGLPADIGNMLARDGCVLPVGELVICAPAVAREARVQGKPLQWHWAHLTIHGILHLLGHDHDDPGNAAEMERVEAELLGQLGVPDPYADRPFPAVGENDPA